MLPDAHLFSLFSRCIVAFSSADALLQSRATLLKSLRNRTVRGKARPIPVAYRVMQVSQAALCGSSTTRIARESSYIFSRAQPVLDFATMISHAQVCVGVNLPLLSHIEGNLEFSLLFFLVLAILMRSPSKLILSNSLVIDVPNSCASLLSPTFKTQPMLICRVSWKEFA